MWDNSSMEIDSPLNLDGATVEFLSTLDNGNPPGNICDITGMQETCNTNPSPTTPAFSFKAFGVK